MIEIIWTILTTRYVGCIVKVSYDESNEITLFIMKLINKAFHICFEWYTILYFKTKPLQLSKAHTIKLWLKLKLLATTRKYTLREHLSSPRLLVGSVWLIFSVFCVFFLCLVPNVVCVLCPILFVSLEFGPVSSSGIRVVQFVLLNVFTSLVPRCDIHYDFRIKRCSIHLYPSALFVFVLCQLCVQCCQCLWIIHSWFGLRFSLTLKRGKQNP